LIVHQRPSNFHTIYNGSNLTVSMQNQRSENPSKQFFDLKGYKPTPSSKVTGEN
jgi:hypothetical protein